MADRTEAQLHHIGEVAETVGLSLRTIRHYEEVELVRPTGRTSGGFRLYSRADIERLRLVKSMKPLDFSLEEMRQLLEALDRLAATGAHDADAAERVAMFAALADDRCARLREQLEAASSLASTLHRRGRRPSR